MKWTRRDALGAGLAALSTATMPAFAATGDYILRPGPIMASVGGMRQELLGFNGAWPGPELRASQSDNLRVRVENGLQEGVLVHWHGLRLPNQMDGVNVLTQDVIPPDGSHDYRFPVPDAGTFWYHSHYLPTIRSAAAFLVRLSSTNSTQRMSIMTFRFSCLTC